MVSANKISCRRLLWIFACVWLPLSAQAVGLSDFKVHSALGQPLSAEIEVTALQAEEFDRVLARIASPEEYQTANAAYLPVLRQLRVILAGRRVRENMRFRRPEYQYVTIALRNLVT